jgi:hypothetical protein
MERISTHKLYEDSLNIMCSYQSFKGSLDDKDKIDTWYGCSLSPYIAKMTSLTQYKLLHAIDMWSL